MLCKYHWIVLYTVHFTAFCLGGGAFFPGHGVVSGLCVASPMMSTLTDSTYKPICRPSCHKLFGTITVTGHGEQEFIRM